MTPVFPVVVSGVGPVPCAHMVVGEAPGREEIEQREPFVGDAGKKLDKALTCCGASRGGVYITNAFKGDVGPDNRDPTVEELADHHPLLMDEIERVRPRIVMSLGLIPTRTLLPDLFVRQNSPLGPLVGKLRYSPVAEIPVMPNYHPAARLSRDARAEWVSTVCRFWAYSGEM